MERVFKRGGVKVEASETMAQSNDTMQSTFPDYVLHTFLSQVSPQLAFRLFSRLSRGGLRGTD